MRSVKRLFWLFLALAFLGFTWVWEKLRPPIRWVIDRIPLEGLKAAVSRWLERLRPYPTLFVFLVPVIALEPMKLVALWLFAKHFWFAGLATYIATDVIRLGLVSFLFRICRDKILTIAWFAYLYEKFVFVHEWAHAQAAPLKAAIRKALENAGLLGSRGHFWRKVTAVWRHARRGGFSRV